MCECVCVYVCVCVCRQMCVKSILIVHMLHKLSFAVQTFLCEQWQCEDELDSANREDGTPPRSVAGVWRWHVQPGGQQPAVATSTRKRGGKDGSAHCCTQ